MVMPVVRGKVEHCSSKGANIYKVCEQEIIVGLTAARGGAAGSGCLGEHGSAAKPSSGILDAETEKSGFCLRHQELTAGGSAPLLTNSKCLFRGIPPACNNSWQGYRRRSHRLAMILAGRSLSVLH